MFDILERDRARRGVEGLADRQLVKAQPKGVLAFDRLGRAGQPPQTLICFVLVFVFFALMPPSFELMVPLSALMPAFFALAPLLLALMPLFSH